MNHGHFDRHALVPFVPIRLTRRGVVGSLGGGGLAAALHLVVGNRAAAQNATPGAIPSLFQEWVAVWGRDPDRADALYADDAVLDDVAFGAAIRGKDEIKAHVLEEFAGFPEHTYELLSAFVAEDRAAAEFRWTATYTGTYPGLPPGTGQAVSLRGAVVIELATGKIRHEAHYYDAYGFLIQLGLLPAPGTPEATPES